MLRRWRLTDDVLLGPLDTAIKIKWPRKRFKQFDDQSALSSLLQPFGTIDSILLSSKFLTNPGVKTGSAVVSFKTVDEAAKVIKKAAIEGSPFEGMTVSWAAGAPPASLSSFPATQEEPATVDADSPSVGSFPFAVSYRHKWIQIGRAVLMHGLTEQSRRPTRTAASPSTGNRSRKARGGNPEARCSRG